MSDHDSMLADVWLGKVGDPKRLNYALKNIMGVVNTSLLAGEVTAIPVVSDQGFGLLKKGSV